MGLGKKKEDLKNDTIEKAYSAYCKQEDNEYNLRDRATDISCSLIKKWEGFREKAYLCPAGKWTIGYGETEDVRYDSIITKEEANKKLYDKVKQLCINISILVNVDINHNQLAALASLCYNIGITKFKGSTLLVLLNQKKYEAASDQFLRWKWADGKIIKGLLNRRNEERVLFLNKEV